MGVTLERVQNKFACIIGELCSEPLLLSQFAIWVDLRISEYKSKGTISLDCSGSSPDPSWLKGHINPVNPNAESNRGRVGSSASIRNSLPHKSIDRSRDSMRLSHSLYQNNNRNTDSVDNTESASERLSPDVVIKDDPDAIFPISIHKHETRSPTVRKRAADPSYTTDQDLSQNSDNYYQDSFSTPKIRRVDSASDEVAVDSPSNQSFMSVIGDSLQDSEDASQIDSSLLTPGDSQSRGGTNLPVNQRFSSPSASFSPMPSTSATPGSSGGPEDSPTTKKNRRKYDCTQCGRIFLRTDHLRRHLTSHMTSPPKLPCPICEKKFIRKDHMMRHMKSKHFNSSAYENDVLRGLISKEKQDLINNEINKYQYYHSMQMTKSVNTSLSTSSFSPGQTNAWELPTQAPSLPTQPLELATQASAMPTQASPLSTQASELATQAPVMPTQASPLSTQPSELLTQAPVMPTQPSPLSTQPPELATQASTMPTQALVLPALPTKSPALLTGVPALPTQVPALTTFSNDATSGTYTSHPLDGRYTLHPSNGTYTSHPSDGTYTSLSSDGTYTSHRSDGTYTSHPANDMYTSHPSSGRYALHPSNGTSPAHPSNGSITEHESPVEEKSILSPSMTVDTSHYNY